MASEDGMKTQTGPGKKWLAPVIILAVLIVIGMILGGQYNSLNGGRRAMEAQWSQVENVMDRQASLIPNLVAAVRGGMKHETRVFDDIAKARQAYSRAGTVKDKQAAGQDMNRESGILLNVIQESYPNLQSSQQVQQLMTQLEGSQNRVTVERRRYIEQVRDYNTMVTSFPMNIAASLFGFHPVEEWHAPASSMKTPSVNLDED